MNKSMMEVRDSTELYYVIRQFRTRVFNEEELSKEQRLQLLSIVEYSYALHEYLVEDGISAISTLVPTLKEAE
ncbi:hypothetical protein [Echinicola vietnamensis]|nr:hypothetical protein [Echinicola vietnamensis]